MAPLKYALTIAAVLVLCLLGMAGACLVACSPPTPAQEASAVKATIDAGRVACKVAQAKTIELSDAQKVWCGK